MIYTVQRVLYHLFAVFPQNSTFEYLNKSFKKIICWPPKVGCYPANNSLFTKETIMNIVIIAIADVVKD